MSSLQEASSSLDASEKIDMMMKHFSTIQNISNKYKRITSSSSYHSPVQTQALQMMTKLTAEAERKRNNVIDSWVADAMREASAGGLTSAKKSDTTTTQSYRLPPRTVSKVLWAEDAAREETLAGEIAPTKSIHTTSKNTAEQLEVYECAATDTTRKEFKSSRERMEEETLTGVITHTKRIRTATEQRMFIDRCISAYGKGESFDQITLTDTTQSSLGKTKKQESTMADDDTMISTACDSSDISAITCPTFDGNTTATSSTIISDSTKEEPRPHAVGFSFNIQQRKKELIDKMSKLSIISKSSQKTLSKGQQTSKDTSTNAIVPTPLDPGNKRRTTCLERRRRSSLSHASSLVTATTTSTELTAASSLCLIDEEINETCVLMF